jgi:hypothetical protein
MVEFPLELFLEGKPFVFGEPNLVSTGATLTPTNIRFYVSSVVLVRKDGTLVPVDAVTPEGVPEAYGVHFFNAEETSSTTMRVLAPAGAYTGVRFLWGLTTACNQSSAGRHAPLSETSQMSWEHLSLLLGHDIGYLFLRYESLLALAQNGSDAGSAPKLFNMIHMGGDPRVDSTPEIRMRGDFSVPASGTLTKTIRILMDELFKGAAMDVDLTGFTGQPSPEVLAGERLRRSVSGLEIFVFAP